MMVAFQSGLNKIEMLSYVISIHSHPTTATLTSSETQMYTATKAVIRANRVLKAKSTLKARAFSKAVQIEANESAQNRSMWAQLKQ